MRNQVIVFSSRGQHPDDFEQAMDPAYFGFCPQTDDGELDVDFVVHRDSSGHVSIRPIGQLHEDKVIIMVLGTFGGGYRHSRPVTREEAEAIAEIVTDLQDREEVEPEPEWTVDLGPDVPTDAPPPVEPAPATPQVPVNVPENPGLGNQPNDPPQIVVPPAPEEVPSSPLGGEQPVEPAPDVAPEPAPGEVPPTQPSPSSEPSQPAADEPAAPTVEAVSAPEATPADGTQDGGEPNQAPETAEQP